MTATRCLHKLIFFKPKNAKHRDFTKDGKYSSKKRTKYSKKLTLTRHTIYLISVTRQVTKLIGKSIPDSNHVTVAVISVSCDCGLLHHTGSSTYPLSSRVPSSNDSETYQPKSCKYHNVIQMSSNASSTNHVQAVAQSNVLSAWYSQIKTLLN